MLLRKKEEIETWLNQYHIKNYELIEDEEYDYVVNVNTTVDLFNKNLKSINVKFNEVNGNFDCSHNDLISLEGCPEIVKNSFNCDNNQLTLLEGCPKIIKGDFYLYDNNISIEEFKNLPKKIITNYINVRNNKKLGNLQNITDFNELKEKVSEILNIKKEKENLLIFFNKKNINKKLMNKI